MIGPVATCAVCGATCALGETANKGWDYRHRKGGWLCGCDRRPKEQEMGEGKTAAECIDGWTKECEGEVCPECRFCRIHEQMAANEAPDEGRCSRCAGVARG